MATVSAPTATATGEEARFTPKVVATIALCSLMMMVEGYDLAAMPLAVPYVSEAWQVPAASFAWTLSAMILGIGLAAVVVAPVGDRIGRTGMIVVTGAIAAGATFGTATAGSMTELFLWRLVTGLALGACLPNITALISRIAPPRMRARMLTLVTISIPMGAVIAGMTASELAALGDWPLIFNAVGVVTVIVTVLIWVVLRSGEMRARSAEPPPPEASATPLSDDGLTAKAKRGLPVLKLLERVYLPSTVVFLGLSTTNTFLFYMLMSWLPTVLPMSGVSVSEAARLSAVLQAGGIGGSLVFAYCLDRKLAVQSLLCGYLLVIGALLALAGGQAGAGTLAAMLLLVGAGVGGAQTAIMIMGMGFYPQHMLSSAVGLQIGVTRAGAVAGPLVGGWVIATSAGMGPFMLAAAASAVAAVVWVLVVPAVRGTWRV